MLSTQYFPNYPIDSEKPTNKPLKLDKSNPIALSSQIMYNKYFEAFNFYFSKHINEIIADVDLPHVIMYKDYQYYDKDAEFLKRFYFKEESLPRIFSLTSFYGSIPEGKPNPNLILHDQNSLIVKRNNKHKNLLVTQTPSESEHSQTSTVPKDFDNILGEDNEMIVNNSFQQLLDMQLEYEDVSYESHEHNMYNPSSSSTSKKSQMNFNKKPITKNHPNPPEFQEFEQRIWESNLFKRAISAFSHSQDVIIESSILVIDEKEGRFGVGSPKFSSPDASNFKTEPQQLMSWNESNIGEKLLKELDRKESPPSAIDENRKTVTHEEILTPKKEVIKNDEKVTPSPKKPFKAKVNLNIGKERKKKTAEFEDNKRNSAKKDESVGRSTEANRANQFERVNEFNKKVQSEESTSSNKAGYYSLKPERNSSREKFIIPATSYRSLTKSKPKEGNYWPLTELKTKKQNKQKTSKRSITNDSETRTLKTEESTNKRSSKTQIQAGKKFNLGINLQSCYSRDKENCIDPLTITQAPKNSRLPAKRSVPKLSLSPRSPPKVRVKKASQISLKNSNYYLKSEEKEVKLSERMKTMRKIYGSRMLYTSGTKSQLGISLGRSKTEEILFTNPSEKSLRTETSSLALTQRQKILTNLKTLTAFTMHKQKELLNKLSPKESGMPEHFYQPNFRTQVSSEQYNSQRENTFNERNIHGISKLPKNVSMVNLSTQKKEKTRFMDSSQGRSQKEKYEYQSLTTRRTTEVKTNAVTQQGSVSKKSQYTSMPLSPKKNSNISSSRKRNLNVQNKKIGEHPLDNSYGFLTNRSSKGNVHDVSHCLNKGGVKSIKGRPVVETDHATADQSRIEMTEEKPKGPKFRRVTKVNFSREFKMRENEMLRSIKNLKPSYLMAIWPKGNRIKTEADRSEEKKIVFSKESENMMKKLQLRTIKSIKKKKK